MTHFSAVKTKPETQCIVYSVHQINCLKQLRMVTFIMYQIHSEANTI